MVDRISKEIRSRIMSKIRSNNTKPELALRKILWGKGFSYQPKMKGSPDFVHKTRKIAIFVHGCFWHKCSKHYIEPSSNKEYWLPKIERNIIRDKENKKILKKKGYKVMTLWEHNVSTGKIPKELFS